MGRWGVPACGLTARVRSKPLDSRGAEVGGIASVAVKCVEIGRNTKGASSQPGTT